MADVAPLVGEISLPGDKSLSHRAAMFSALATGTSHFYNVSDGGDVASTIGCLEKLGAQYEHRGTQLVVHGQGLHSLHGKDVVLDCGNSGTTLRLLTGLLSGQELENVSLVGDESLSRRPHKRVIDPLQSVGVDIKGRDGSFTPVVLNKSQPTGGAITMSIASAQVKSALLLSGLYATSSTTVHEVVPTRNHTENMLSAMGGELEISHDQLTITIHAPEVLNPLEATIPGDPSSAAFFGVAASIIPGSNVLLKDVLLNPTRIGWIYTLQSMGADIAIDEKAPVMGEHVGDIRITYSDLNAGDIRGEIIPSLIDEIPILAVAMSNAKGTSHVRDASELRVKESDRITTVVNHLNEAGISTTEQQDGFDVEGGTASVIDINSDGDHRIAMAFSILNYSVNGKWNAVDESVVATSFPRFFHLFDSLRVR
jgi:3-phosphoshikimate 1-carboxyvinyltransferase